MATSDIQRLRQQAMFNIAPQQDLMGGMGDDGGGMGYMGPMGGAYRPPPMPEDFGGGEVNQPPPSSPFDFLRPQQPSPTFPTGPSIAPGQTPADPNKTAAGAASLAGMTLDEYINAINKGYTPDFTDRDRMRGNLDAAPVRERPSFARSLVAAALSTKAEDPIATAEKVQYAPHFRAMADWTAKNEPFYKAADLENRQNINERTLMSNAVSAKTQADRLAENARQADEKVRIQEIRAKAYAWKQMHPDWDWDTTGPTYVIKGPNGEIKDTGIKTGQMSEEDLQLLKNKGSVAAAQARGAATIANTQAAGRGLIQVNGVTYEPDENGNYVPVTGLPQGVATRPGTPSSSRGAVDTPTQAKDRRQQQLRSVYENNPQYQDLFINRNGTLELKKRPELGYGWNPFGTGQEELDRWDEVNKLINPNYTPPAKAGAQSSGVGPTGTQKPSEGGRGGGPGLGPTNAPATGGGRGGGPTAAPTYRVQRDENNPQSQRRSADGGKTWEYSTDGGKTWKKR